MGRSVFTIGYVNQNRELLKSYSSHRAELNPHSACPRHDRYADIKLTDYEECAIATFQFDPFDGELLCFSHHSPIDIEVRIQ
jgi:hypothetical protein